MGLKMKMSMSVKLSYSEGEEFDPNSTTKDYYLCITEGCGKRAEKTCKCSLSENVCPNGHRWHTDPSGIVRSGFGRLKHEY